MARPFQFKLPPFDGHGGLTPEQRRAVNCEEAIFTGIPGTGKTTVAIWRIKKLKDNILLTYTRLLSAAIGHLTDNNTAGIWGAHEWYYNRCNGANLNDELDQGTALQTLQSNGVRLGKVIIDEGQDLQKDFYNAIKSIAQRISIGTDDAQQLYDVDVDTATLQRIFPGNINNTLTRNFRNRYNIYNFARQFIPENPQANDPMLLQRLRNERPGGIVEVHIKSLEDDINALLVTIIENKGEGNIGILLSTKVQVDNYSQILEEQEISHSKYHSGLFWRDKRKIENNLQNILVTTYKSAKGLEFDTVIMPELENFDDQDSNQYYVGASRAKSSLYLIGQEMSYILHNFDSSTYSIDNQNLNQLSINPPPEDDDEDDLPF